MGVLRRRVAAVTAALAVSVGAWSSAVLPASAAGCTTKFTTYSTVKAGTKGAKAGAVECLLHQAGYATSRNRSFSVKDAKKLKAFQKKHALKATGRTDRSTWTALVAQGTTPALRRGSRGADVRRLQLSLRALGHPELPGTTTYGVKTEAAVKDLQSRLGLAVTGRTTATEWAALQAGGRAASAPATPATPPPGDDGGGTSGGSPATSTAGATALAFAKAQLGEPYKYGAAGPSSWDCSGLTMRAWEKAGVRLPHNAAAQYKLGRKVAKADLQPGDLVFFYDGPSHVGIYAGDGEIIHAPKPGSKVTYIKMSYMPWKGARRPG
jgi:cell wall-associated NlpC family hydrolase